MRKKIVKLSSNCENCINKPCQVGCPLNNDIPAFIKEVRKRKYKKAFDILSKTSVLMPICGRICPHYNQCQGSCVKGISYSAVEIGELEAFVGDMALKNKWKIESLESENYKVAVVGSGPAGLTCAAFLKRNGINVTIYEKYDYLGGLLMHGIPEFRLPKKIVKKVCDEIVNSGIEVKYNTELGKDITLKELKEEYDAVFFAIGANVSKKMQIEGEDLLGVYGANDIFEKNSHPDYKGKVVIVSGGGDVAMDISRYAKRNGAKRVIVVYRRSRKEMPADKKEIEAAKLEGVEFLYLTNIEKILGEEKVEKIEVTKNVRAKNADKKTSPSVIRKSNYKIRCDYVIMAIGSQPDKVIDDLNLDKTKDRILINKDGQTSDKNVYAGGDIAGVKSTVAFASRSGRNAAYKIIEDLKERK